MREGVDNIELEIISKFKPLFDAGDEVRYYIVSGGRGSGKSHAVGQFVTDLSMEKGHNILYSRYTMTSATLSIIPEFLKKVDSFGWGHYFEINKDRVVNKLSKTIINFRGIKTSSGIQTANLKSIAGISTWIVDEAEELENETIFDTIDLSIREKGVHNRVILVLNPTSKTHWVYKRFFEDRGVDGDFNGIKGDTCYINTSYLDSSKYLSPSFLDSAKYMKENKPEKYQHTMLGQWLDKAEGVVYTNWIEGEFQEPEQSVFGQDYGFSIDPTVLLQCSIDNLEKKIYVRECFSKQAMTTSQIYDLNNRYAGKNKIIGDSAEVRLIKELKIKGNNIVGVKKGAGTIASGITMVSDYQIVVDPSSENIIRELRNYVWSDRQSGKPVDKWNHFLDSLRYVVMSHPRTGNYDYLYTRAELETRHKKKIEDRELMRKGMKPTGSSRHINGSIYVTTNGEVDKAQRDSETVFIFMKNRGRR